MSKTKQEKVNIFEELMFNALDDGKKIVLKHVNINSVFTSDDIICPINLSSIDTGSSKTLWVLLEEKALLDFFGKGKYEIMINSFNKRKDSFIVFGEKEQYFLYNINIEGYYSTFRVPSQEGMKMNKGVVATKITKSSLEKDWKRGSLFLQSENDNEFAILSESIRKRIAKALEPYHDSEIFDYLFAVISRDLDPDNKDPKEFFLEQCKSCGEYFILHKIELQHDKNPDSLYCRNCGDWRYESIVDIPIGIPFFINSYHILNKLLNNKEVNIEEAGKLTTLDHRLEVGVTLRLFRSKIKEFFNPRKYKYQKEIDKAINEAKTKNFYEFKRLLSDLENISSKTSLQTTKDISRINDQMSNKFMTDIFDFMYPHPMKDSNNIVEIDSILLDRFTDQINLYKDVYDLFSDHLFISNLGRIINGNKYDKNCISKKLFGKRLVDKTLKEIKGTRLERLVNDNYDNKLRNSIGHAGRYIDLSNGKVELFNKGKLINTMQWKKLLEKVYKITDLHMELVHAKYRMAMYDDKNFLATGGILSIQPDIFDNKVEDTEQIPGIVINQLWSFEDYSPDLEWWYNNINITTGKDSEEKYISFSIKRKNSKYGDSPKERSSIWVINQFIEEWIKKVLDMGFINILYCKCYPSIDFMKDNEASIPVTIPLDFVQSEGIYFITQMNISGKIDLDERLRLELFKVL